VLNATVVSLDLVVIRDKECPNTYSIVEFVIYRTALAITLN
jgi:hypothetical protein